MYEAVQARAIKGALAEQLSDAMQTGNISKVAMAQRMVTSRSQLDRVLDPDNLSKAEFVEPPVVRQRTARRQKAAGV